MKEKKKNSCAAKHHTGPPTTHWPVPLSWHDIWPVITSSLQANPEFVLRVNKVLKPFSLNE